ncbi:MAG: hypothetical protein COA69_12700 [Robiginitomaculum sp.]|nr:MAG: hypothetical protein COA69_12700 [Robiginitomaculum sp.]
MSDDTPINPEDQPNDWEKRQWQQEQLARDAAQDKQRLKDERARARRARTDLRKLQKAKADLKKLGEITDWEEEFSGSVEERLEKYGSAFTDLQKGAPSDALSRLQKQVLAQMRKKARDKGKQAPEADGKSWQNKSSFKPRSSFKNKSGFKPRVRHIEDELGGDEPDMTPPAPPRPKGKPSLRIIKGGKS